MEEAGRLSLTAWWEISEPSEVERGTLQAIEPLLREERSIRQVGSDQAWEVA
jgi:hypothetical protein